MVEGGSCPIWINPLAFLEVDEPWASTAKTPLTAEAILSFLCQPGMQADSTSLIERYKQINSKSLPLFAVPAEPLILGKLIWPLRHAKASYITGNNLAVVALCGMVSEMVAILLWELTEVNLNARPMKPKDEEALFGRSFERLGQERRVKVLKACEIVSPEVKEMFDTIRGIRSKYLHLWSKEHDELPKDALACFNAATGLVVEVIGQEIDKDGAFILSPRLVKYLERQRMYEPPSEPTG